MYCPGSHWPLTHCTHQHGWCTVHEATDLWPTVLTNTDGVLSRKPLTFDPLLTNTDDVLSSWPLTFDPLLTNTDGVLSRKPLTFDPLYSPTRMVYSPGSHWPLTHCTHQHGWCTVQEATDLWPTVLTNTDGVLSRKPLTFDPLYSPTRMVYSPGSHWPLTQCTHQHATVLTNTEGVLSRKPLYSPTRMVYSPGSHWPLTHCTHQHGLSTFQEATDLWPTVLTNTDGVLSRKPLYSPTRMEYSPGSHWPLTHGTHKHGWCTLQEATDLWPTVLTNTDGVLSRKPLYSPTRMVYCPGSHWPLTHCTHQHGWCTLQEATVLTNTDGVLSRKPLTFDPLYSPTRMVYSPGSHWPLTHCTHQHGWCTVQEATAHMAAGWGHTGGPVQPSGWTHRGRYPLERLRSGMHLLQMWNSIKVNF